MTFEQTEGLRRLAALRNRSQAAVLRDALDGLLADEQVARLVESARDITGRFSSGRIDTSDHHDEVLDEVFGS